MTFLQQKRLLSFVDDLEDEECEDKEREINIKRKEKKLQDRKEKKNENQEKDCSLKHKKKKIKDNEISFIIDKFNTASRASLPESSNLNSYFTFSDSSSSQLRKFTRIGQLTQERFSLEREADVQRKKTLADKEKLDLVLNIFKQKQNAYQNNIKNEESNKAPASSWLSITNSSASSSVACASLFCLDSKIVEGRKFTLRLGFAESQGMRDKMEDKAVILTNFCIDSYNLSYCAIFDGHNGVGASSYAQQNLHKLIHSRIQTMLKIRNNYKRRNVSNDNISESENNSSDLDEEERTKVKEGKEEKKNQLRNDEDDSVDINFSNIFKDAFNQLDNDYLLENPFSVDGSTALVCIQDGVYVHLAHIGDSRAVLGRKLAQSKSETEQEMNDQARLPFGLTDAEGSKSSKTKEKVKKTKTDIVVEAVRLTDDHKPNRPDETKRIKMNGGDIIHIGCPRVGVADLSYCLAVSRAFGDFPLKQKARNVLICEPECNKRHLLNTKDEFIIMASDGLWDVCTDQDACNIVHNFLLKEKDIKENQVNCNILTESCDDAARQLIKEALDRGTEDNISCIVLVFDWK